MDVVILAGGKSTRFKQNGKTINKLLLTLNNKKIIDYSINYFINSKHFSNIIVVCNNEVKDYLISQKLNILFANAGNYRCNSTINGIQKCNSEYVVIHDAARPFIDNDYISEAIKNIKKYNCIVPVRKINDTTKYIESNFSKTICRTNLFSVQTPQFFKTKILKDIILKNDINPLEITDDSLLFERFTSEKILFINNSRLNIKITDLQDINYIKMILKVKNI